VDIAPGEGKIVHRGTHRIAMYCDWVGEIHACSAVCPHLGGIVRWNGFEKSWDCPCHASRFEPSGKLIHGPANSDLEPLGVERALYFPKAG
jgi:Rieske Fe-S protein